jgi:hypothetical protein
MLCAYVGSDARMYPDYVLASTGRMLEPVPGEGPYDIKVAPGRNPTLPLPPGDGRWHAVSAEDIEIADLIAGVEALPEPAAETPEDAALEPEPWTPAEVPPDGAQDEPEAPGGEPAPEDAPEPENPAEEATDHTEGVE